MKKLRMNSKDMAQDNVLNIRYLFPDCVTEVYDPATGQASLSVDIEKLKETLGEESIVGGGGGVLSFGLARESGGIGTRKQANVKYVAPSYL